MSERLAPSERHQFLHNGEVVYEWDQSLSEVNLYIAVPEGVRAKQLYVDISNGHIRVGIAPNPPYLDKDFACKVKASESFWTLDGNSLQIQLTKSEVGEPWPSALEGHAIDSVTQVEEKKRLMLERFQAEHPGFDFSGAQFTGETPNPRTFMGGMKSS